jgi:hypothetical protein
LVFGRKSGAKRITIGVESTDIVRFFNGVVDDETSHASAGMFCIGVDGYEFAAFVFLELTLNYTPIQFFNVNAFEVFI